MTPLCHSLPKEAIILPAFPETVFARLKAGDFFDILKEKPGLTAADVLGETSDMDALNDLLKSFVTQSQKILGDNLIGIYLHGSAVMGCYNEKKSDIDLLVVVEEAIPKNIKHCFLDMVVELNTYASPKGIELSIVKREVCDPFIYPTPFELHFSVAHLEWYKADPFNYIDKMKGTDKDLAAHFTIINHRGKCLYGSDIKDVFGAVSKEDYFDSIWSDVEEAETEIMNDPPYVILNLCRVLAYKKEELILSKQEGGKWGICNVPEKYHTLIVQALDEYLSDKSTEWDENIAHEYAVYMITQIRD